MKKKKVNWEGKAETYREEVLMNEDEKNICNRLMLQVVERCVREQFPIEEYHLFDIPYSNVAGILYCFLHNKEYEAFKNGKVLVSNVRGIDFFSRYDGDVTPLKLAYENRKGFTPYEQPTCEEAVSYCLE